MKQGNLLVRNEENLKLLGLNGVIYNNVYYVSQEIYNIFRELILSCCTEFIHLVSSEANDICNTQNKKTINAEHVLQGL